MPPDSAPAHRYLREATRQEHAAAERVPIMQALMHGRLDEASYGRLLLAQHAFHQAWEGHHRDWLQGPVAAAGWCYQRRSDALRLDLDALGLRAEAEQTRAESGADSSTIRGPSASWGGLYVIEGSALGGQMMARLLEKRFPGHAHHFFRLGLQTGRGTWRAFQMILDQHLPDPSSRHTAAVAARAMFHRAQRMLEAVRP